MRVNFGASCILRLAFLYWVAGFHESQKLIILFSVVQSYILASWVLWSSSNPLTSLRLSLEAMVFFEIVQMCNKLGVYGYEANPRRALWIRWKHFFVFVKIFASFGIDTQIMGFGFI